MYIRTKIDRKCQNASKCVLPTYTERKKSSSHTMLDPTHAFGLSRPIFFCRKQWGKGVHFRLFPYWGSRAFLTGPNWNMHNKIMYFKTKL